MNTYLTIITTALVLTQIIRLTQNTIQLKRQDHQRKEQMEMFEKYSRLVKALGVENINGTEQASRVGVCPIFNNKESCKAAPYSLHRRHEAN